MINRASGEAALQILDQCIFLIETLETKILYPTYCQWQLGGIDLQPIINIFQPN